MPVIAVIGALWGDEGKGKIVDLLAGKAGMVVRFSGGPNAGHTVHNPYGKFSLHLVPSGIFYPHTTCLIGNGVVVSPSVLLGELEQLWGKGIDTSRLFISTRAHHKHSEYLITASDLFGLRQRELEIIGNVARYHRRALPQRNHPSYVTLDREERVIASKLAAILRVANALDREHLQKVRGFSVSREGDKIVLSADGLSDLTMERAALAGRSDFFGDVFGKQIVLREAPQKP